jgi:hypothetical protein
MDIIVDLEDFKWKKPVQGRENIISPPLPFNDGPLKDFILDPEGVVIDLEQNENIQLLLCKSCFSSVKKKKITSALPC